MHTENFSNISMFGISSLGGNPENNRISVKDLNPKRVCDPLHWIMVQNGMNIL